MLKQMNVRALPILRGERRQRGWESILGIKHIIVFLILKIYFYIIILAKILFIVTLILKFGVIFF
jgi:hypothetical protein